MNRFKQGLIVFTILTLSLIQTSQALTLQEIISGQQGQVLGASTPVRIGSTQTSSYGKTLTFTASGGVAQGHTIVVSVVTTGIDPTASGWTSCSDSAGNTYSRDAAVFNGIGAVICSAYVTTALSAGATITITFSSNDGLSGAAYDLSPTISTGRINVTGTASNGYGSAMTVAASTAVTSASIVLGVFATGATQSSFTNCTGLDANVANGQGRNLNTCWAEASSGTPSLTMNLASATSGASLLVGYTESAGTPPPADTTAPTVPTNLSATAVSASGINLSWTASTDAVGVAGYKIYRNGSLLATSNSQLTTFSDSGLSASTNYSYTVAAYDAAGNNSSQSSSASATTQAAAAPDTTAPTVPTGLSATAISSSAINLSWTASTDAVGVAGYKIYRNGSLLTTTNSQLTTYSDTGLAASTSYSYTVAAYDAAGNNSSQSSSASATTQAQASGNCSAANIRCVGSGQEYTTISAAAAATVAGDTVVVYPGTYNESVTISRSGSSGNKITYQGFLPGSSCPSTTYSDINSRGFRPAPTVIMNGFTVSASYIRIDCFNTNGNGVLDITQPNIHDVESVNNYSAAGAGGSVGVSLNDQLTLATSAQNIYVGYNFISGGGYGVLQKCRNCKYEYNEFYQMNPGSSGADGDYARIFGNDITFYKNYMHGNDRNLCGGTDCHIDCFQTFAYTADFPAYNITIDSNVCFNASEGVIATNESKLSVFHDWTIKNNLIAHAPLNYYGAQCMIISDITNVTVINNTCSDAGVTTYANTTTGIHRNNIHERVGTYLAYRMIGGANVTADHNLLYDTGYTYTSSGDVVNKSPLFVNSSIDDYHLQSTSPAVNAGANIGLSVDISGASRPQGAGYDIGAYEYASGGSNPPPDTTAPTVPTGLSATAISSSAINLSWTASTDAVGVTGYKIYRNGSLLATNNSTATTYSNTGLTSSTSYSYTVAAFDAAGNTSAQSSSASATTQAPPLTPDVTAPTVSLTSPSSGTVSGSVTVSATASDPSIGGAITSGLSLLTITIDGTVYATSSLGSLSKTLDTTSLTNASHSIVATAKDSAGNQASSNTTTITINNAPAAKYPRLITLTSLEGLSAIPSNQSITVTILSGSTVLETQTLTPNASKQYTVTFLSTDPQLVDIRVKVNNYLSSKLTSIDTTQNTASVSSIPQLLVGDINNDNTINSLDYSSLNSNWLKTTFTGDMNGDGLVNSIDFAILKNNYNKSGN